MEATADLSTILDQETFDAGAYDAVKELAFANPQSMDRFRSLLGTLREKAGNGDGRSQAGALKLGMCYLLFEEFDEAARWLEAAGPSAQASYYLGSVRVEQRRYAEAMSRFEEAAQRGWDKLDCDCRRAEVHVLSGERDEARRILQAQSQAGAACACWRYAMGRLAEAEGDVDGAVEHYERALECDPKHTQAMFHLAYLLDLHGSDERAFELYLACAKQPVVHSNVLMNLAVAHEDRGEYDEAARCLRRVLAMNPNHLRAQLYLKDVLAAASMYIDEQKMKDQERQNAVLDIPVTDFELSVRSRNCLKRMNIATLGDLLRITEAELLAYKNFGETSLKEIKAMLAQKGLSLGQYAQEEPEEASRARPLAPEGNPEVLGRPVSSMELSVRARKCLQRLGITTIGELAAKTEAELLGSKNFGMMSLSEIKRRLEEMGLSLRSVE